MNKFMNFRPLFPTPIACIPNFITSKERLQLTKSINNRSGGMTNVGSLAGVSTICSGAIT